MELGLSVQVGRMLEPVGFTGITLHGPMPLCGEVQSRGSNLAPVAFLPCPLQGKKEIPDIKSLLIYSGVKMYPSQTKQIAAGICLPASTQSGLCPN